MVTNIKKQKQKTPHISVDGEDIYIHVENKCISIDLDAAYWLSESLLFAAKIAKETKITLASG